jgi:DNA-directed RNA polymerase specialized sigma24 family protein
MATTELRDVEGDQQDAGTAVRSTASAQALLLGVLREHADELLQVARAHSLCADDAHDAYQRSLELFLRHGRRLRAQTARGWLFTVVKREAQAVRRSRSELVGWEDVDPERLEARHVASPEERALAEDMVARSTEALHGLKPAELRALWLRASGHSYAEIRTSTGWTHTKVNRSVSEGRRAFLARYAQIDEGAECARWAPALGAVAGGDADAAALQALRPHLRNCPGCKATLRGLRARRPAAASALSPALLAPAAGRGQGLLERLMGWPARVLELVTGPAQERAAAGALRVQTALEAASTGKLAVVATSAAALAGGGAVAVHGPAGDVSARHSAPGPAARHVRDLAHRARIAPRATPLVVTAAGPSGSGTVSPTIVGRRARSAAPVGVAPLGSPARREFTAPRAPRPPGGEFTEATPPRPQTSRAVRRHPAASRSEFTARAEPTPGAAQWAPAPSGARASARALARAPASAATAPRPAPASAAAEFGP